MLTTPCLPVTTNQPSSNSIHETYNEISTNSNKSTSKLKDLEKDIYEETLDIKESVIAQTKKEPKSDKSKAGLTPSKKKSKTKKSTENEPKPVLKVEVKKLGSSSRGGLPDFSRKLSDIKARLKPVEDPKPKEVSSKITKAVSSTREAPNKQTNLSENISTKPVPIVNNTASTEIVNSQPHGHVQGPLCPMHAHAHAQRKASKEESHQQNDNTNINNADKNNADKKNTDKDTSEPIAAPRGRKLTDSSSRKSSSQSVDRKHRQHSASTSSDVRRRTPSCSSDDNLLSDRSEKSFGG